MSSKRSKPDKQTNANPSEPDTKPKKTLELKLTPIEVVHLRDLFSVILTSEMKSTVSQALARTQSRSLVESKLWQKVVEVCKRSRIPVGDEAPDFVVAATGAPSVNVFELSRGDTDEETTSSDEHKTIFDGNTKKDGDK